MLKIYEIIGANKLIGYDEEAKRLYDIVEIPSSVSSPIISKAKEAKKHFKNPVELKALRKEISSESNEVKPWSRKHDVCTQCLKSDSPHSSGGVCKRCYLANYRNSNSDRKPRDSEPKNKYECLDCSHSFKSEPLQSLLRSCPKCSGNVIQK